HDLIVGTASSCGGPNLPLTWRPGGQPHPLPVLHGTTGGIATTVNDRGEIGGHDQAHRGISLPVDYYNGGTHPLPTPGSGAFVVHTARWHEFVGQAFVGDGIAARWRRGHIRLLGKLPNDQSSTARGSNAHGDAVGVSFRINAIRSHAVLYHDGRVIRLRDLP